MVSKAHCMSFLCTELLLFNYAKVKTVFHYTPLILLVSEYLFLHQMEFPDYHNTVMKNNA